MDNEIDFEKIAEEMCEHYCKYPDIWDEEKEGTPLCESDYCKNCPLNKITAIKEGFIWAG